MPKAQTQDRERGTAVNQVPPLRVSTSTQTPHKTSPLSAGVQCGPVSVTGSGGWADGEAVGFWLLATWRWAVPAAAWSAGPGALSATGGRCSP